MATINLKQLQPSRISRNLKGKFLLIYGEPKIGKTTLLSQLPKSLILAFEPGTNALDNVFIQPIDKWTDFKRVIMQLKDNELKDKFDFIGIDTADRAWDMCCQYICEQKDVDDISEIPYGKGYDSAKKEFANAFIQVANLKYGLCFISHSTEKLVKDEKGNESNRIVPALPTRPYDIINKMVDIICYIREIKEIQGENVIKKRYLFFRGDDRFLAGSRYEKIVPRVEFSYQNLVNAIQDAIDAQVSLSNNNTTDDYNVFYEKKIEESFDEIMVKAKNLWIKLTTGNEANAIKILQIVEEIFGKKMKISEALPSQSNLLALVVEQMEQMGKEG